VAPVEDMVRVGFEKGFEDFIEGDSFVEEEEEERDEIARAAGLYPDVFTEVGEVEDRVEFLETICLGLKGLLWSSSELEGESSCR